MAAATENRHQRRFPARKVRSACWTALLLPFLFLPYRWLWFPCALAGVLLIISSRDRLNEILRRDGTLVVGSMVVLVLRTALDPAWWLPWIVLVLVLMLVRWRWQWPKAGLLFLPVIVLVSVGLLADVGDWFRSGSPGHLPGPETVLVCAGDSLTSGVTPRSDADTYVARLRERLGCRVINAGVASDRVGDLSRRLDRTVLSHKPALVLLFIGGNDYLDGTPRGRFAAELDEVASRLASAGCRLVIIEVPTGIIWDPYAGLYRRTARRHGSVLVPETRLRCWYSAELVARSHLAQPLTLDGIHLSPAGATRVADWIEPYIRQALHK